MSAGSILLASTADLCGGVSRNCRLGWLHQPSNRQSATSGWVDGANLAHVQPGKPFPTRRHGVRRPWRGVGGDTGAQRENGDCSCRRTSASTRRTEWNPTRSPHPRRIAVTSLKAILASLLLSLALAGTAFASEKVNINTADAAT